MTPLERADAIMREHGIMGSNSTAIRDAIQKAIIEATNSEVERRRLLETQLELVICGMEMYLHGIVTYTGDNHYLGSVMERIKCRLECNPIR